MKFKKEERKKMINDGKVQRLQDLNGGAAEIEFREALAKVVENLNDQKCDGKTVRKINSGFITKVRSIKAENSVQTEDNGTVNKVTRKEGIELNMDREIIKLKPYRTFSEVEQPQTPFIFRATLKNGEVHCALLECDGGAWLNQARLNIKAYLEAALPEIPVLA